MGFLIQGLIQTYITFDGKLSSWWSKIVTGFLLFAFIAFPRKTARRPERWRNAMKSNLVVIPPGRDHSNQAEVTRTIGIDIIVDRYPEGTSLPREAELTAMFDVSRTVLRESVKTLSAKGPLNSKAGVGARVRERRQARIEKSPSEITCLQYLFTSGEHARCSSGVPLCASTGDVIRTSAIDEIKTPFMFILLFMIVSPASSVLDDHHCAN